MSRFKKWIQKLLLFLLKKLNMSLPFSEFKSINMYAIHKMLASCVDNLERSNIPLYSLPDIIHNGNNIQYDKNSNYGTLQYKTNSGVTCSINIDSQFNVLTMDIDNDTENLIKQLVVGYLKRKNFLN